MAGNGRGSPPLPILVMNKKYKEGLVHTIEGIDKATKEILKVPLENVPVGNLTTIADLRMIDRICTSIENSDGVLILDDAEYDFLLAKWKAFGGWIPAARNKVIPVADKLGV